MKRTTILPPIDTAANQYYDEFRTTNRSNYDYRKAAEAEAAVVLTKRISKKNLALHDEVLFGLNYPKAATKMNNNKHNNAVELLKTKSLMAADEELLKPMNEAGVQEPPVVTTTTDTAVLVKCKIIFSRMGTINTKMERFDCQAYIECCWEDDSMLDMILNELQLGSTLKKNSSGFVASQNQVYERVCAHLKQMKYNPEKHWSPRIYVENAIGELKEEKFYKFELADKEASATRFTLKYTVRVYEMKFVKGVFYERLELYDFPLDCQELSIKLTSHFTENEVKFSENKSDPCAISTSVFLNQQEWDLFDYVKCRTITIKDTFKNVTKAGFSVSAFIARKPGYYINNAYTLIFLITVLGFVPFSVDLMQPNARATVAGVLILTQVNFRWIITQRLPTVPYLTSIDKYAIGNLLFLFVFACWHSIVGSQVFDEITLELRMDIDNYVLLGFAGLFGVYTLVYVIWVKRMQMIINRKKLNKT